MENEKIPFDESQPLTLTQALSYLDEGYVLSTVTDLRRNYLVKKGEEVIIASGEMKAPIKMKDFIVLYKDSIFYLVKDDEPTYDPVKDEQYYSWGKKM